MQTCPSWSVEGIGEGMERCGRTESEKRSLRGQWAREMQRGSERLEQLISFVNGTSGGRNVWSVTNQHLRQKQ